MLADMATQIAAARHLLRAAACSGPGDFPDMAAAAQAKIFAAEMAIRVTNDALQIHGSSGYGRDLPLERMPLVPGEAVRVGGLAVAEVQGQDAHADEAGAVDPFEGHGEPLPLRRRVRWMSCASLPAVSTRRSSPKGRPGGCVAAYGQAICQTALMGTARNFGPKGRVRAPVCST